MLPSRTIEVVKSDEQEWQETDVGQIKAAGTFYLHAALSLLDTGFAMNKTTCKHDECLPENIQKRIEQKEYPIPSWQTMVIEG